MNTDHLAAVPGEPGLVISSINRQGNHIGIDWNNGDHSLFHHIWLRDNCRCQQCGDRSGGHSYLETGSISADITPAEVSLDASGSLVINWKNDGHLSQYSAAWLSANCYSAKAVAARRRQPDLWDSSISSKLPSCDFEQIRIDDAARLKMFESIEEHGFVIIDGLTSKPEQIEQLAAVFGFIRETHYGRVFDLISTPQQRILAQTSHAIRPHNDELFRDPIPGLLMMHCLQPSDCGGGASVFVDGFKAAHNLRAQNRDLFDLLCQVPLRHQRFLVDEVDDVALSAYWHCIQLDHFEEVVAVHINERTLAPLDTPEDMTEAMYEALKALLALVYADDARISYRLEAGQAIVLDNHRVLHAREAFKGNRHIRQCHVDRDEFFSRLGALRRRVAASH